jgi:hypothetical protein
MNCSEFRRQLLIDPRAPELAQAAQDRVCDDASARLAEALAFEHRLDQALQISVPTDLAERVLAALPAELAQDAAPAVVRPPTRRWPLALAASLGLLALLSSQLWRGTAITPTDDLIAVAVQHLSHEPYALTRQETVPPALVQRMFTEAGLSLDQRGLTLNYLNRCPLPQRWSVHMVMQGPEGPVTVMYVPGEQAVERMDTRHDMVAVRTLPYAKGALVLLAESNRDFDRVEHAWHLAAGEVQTVAAGER